MKAAGLNTVCTYIPWNLHEEKEEMFKFEGLWDIERFVSAVHAVGLKLIVRPGPYICSEWEYGGLPSWLLAQKVTARSSKDARYLRKVERYFQQLIPILVRHQYSTGKGPIIAFQIENEFGHYGNDKAYLTFLKDLFVKAGVVELLFTSDGGKYLSTGNIPGTLAMVNFQTYPHENLGLLQKLQPDKAQMVAEFWDGWFDHWGEKHHVLPTKEVVKLTEEILSTGASINFYMFVGGTNFGFWNGANFEAVPTITSYDYDAAISEDGRFTEKAAALRDLFVQMNLVSRQELPDVPESSPPKAYEGVQVTEFMSYMDIADLVKDSRRYVANALHPQFMEHLNFTAGGSAGYGWLLYRSKIKQTGRLSVDGLVRDRAQVFVDSIPAGLIKYHQDEVRNMPLPDFQQKEGTLDIFVENMGRVNYGRGRGVQSLDSQHKGMNGKVVVNGAEITNWECIPVDFSDDFNRNVLSPSNRWKRVVKQTHPAAYRGVLSIEGSPTDTFLSMKQWGKGIVLVNGFNIGRYWNVGPQQTLYVPHPFLKDGKNEIVVFELHRPATSLTFSAKPILDDPQPSNF